MITRITTTILSSVLALVLLMAGLAVVHAGDAASQQLTAQYRQWITQIRDARRGPFRRIRWFCADGTRKAPKPGNCAAHGGGIQHGEWTGQVREMRKQGYLVANVLAEYVDPNSDLMQALDKDALKQILLEKFLINFDDGWLFHQSRFYRGSLQIEDELRGAAQLKNWAVNNTDADSQDFLLLREVNRLLPKALTNASADRMRESATQVASKDRGFEPLRVKLHGIPQLEDALAVRQYAVTKGKPELREDYYNLAVEIEKLFAVDLQEGQQSWLKKLANVGTIGKLHWEYQSLSEAGESEKRFASSASILAALRDEFPREKQKQLILDASLQLEPNFFAASGELIQFMDEASRGRRLYWLATAVDGLYGLGLISQRERKETVATIGRLQVGPVGTLKYREALNTLARLPGWSNRWMNFHFSDTVKKLATIEPLAVQYIPARLRGTSLQFYTEVLGSLIQDANILAGVQNKVFDESFVTGVRPLNAGIAQGKLKVADGSGELDPNGIYLLPHTTAELTPVAGILTRGEGNALSHVQLLAANLGIPNIVVDDKLAQRLTDKEGLNVTLAVSPGGTVHLVESSQVDKSLFETRDAPPEVAIVPDLEKLDLQATALKTLSELRARDSGRIAGPKAANLGELKHYFPRAVVEGVVVPFGVFNQLLDQPMRGKGESIRKWMQRQYRSLKHMDGELLSVATDVLLRDLRYRLENIKLDAEFEKHLKRKLQQVFGEDGSYAVFVRSDTNIEDLPGFTGAGLNLTVPNVVGADQIIKAMKRVWASPFTSRAYAWRQGRMENPEHVYPSILLMKTVPVDKSGVMLTVDTETGLNDAFSIAVNRGIGGAVQGQSAEELRLDRKSGEVRLKSESTSPVVKVINKMGGLRKMKAPAQGAVVTADEIMQLLALGRQAEKLIPQVDEQGEPTPADIEFGFEQGQLRLFQIRPYLRNKRAQQHLYLLALDTGLRQENNNNLVDMNEIPRTP